MGIFTIVIHDVPVHSANSAFRHLESGDLTDVLLKFVCHNIVVLIHSIYELDIEPAFWAEADCLKSHEAAPISH